MKRERRQTVRTNAKAISWELNIRNYTHTHTYMYPVGLCMRNKQQAFSVFLISDVSSWRFDFSPRPTAMLLPPNVDNSHVARGKLSTTRYLRFQLRFQLHSDDQTPNLVFLFSFIFIIWSRINHLYELLATWSWILQFILKVRPMVFNLFFWP